MLKESFNQMWCIEGEVSLQIRMMRLARVMSWAVMRLGVFVGDQSRLQKADDPHFVSESLAIQRQGGCVKGASRLCFVVAKIFCSNSDSRG